MTDVARSITPRPPVSERSRNASLFMLLPPEIREEIYKYTLPPLVDLNIPSRHSPERWRGLYYLGPHTSLAILCVSKTIHAEALAILYKSPHFNIHISVLEKNDITRARNFQSRRNPHLSLQNIESISIYTGFNNTYHNIETDSISTSHDLEKVYYEVWVTYTAEPPTFRSWMNEWVDADGDKLRMQQAATDLQRAHGPDVGLEMMRDDDLVEKQPEWDGEKRLEKMIEALEYMPFDWDVMLK